MGDRCYMEIKCRRLDVQRFIDAGFHYAPSDDDGVIATMCEEERNFGDTDSLPRDIPYTGFHDAGDEYAGSVFACDGVEFVEIEALGNTLLPAVAVDEHGRVDITVAHAYWRVYRNASSMLATDYIRVAKETYADRSDDNIEIDDDAEVGFAGDGAWVRARVWVRHPEPTEPE